MTGQDAGKSKIVARRRTSSVRSGREVNLSRCARVAACLLADGFHVPEIALQRVFYGKD